MTVIDIPHQWEAALAAAFSTLKWAEVLTARDDARLDPALPPFGSPAIRLAVRVTAVQR